MKHKILIFLIILLITIISTILLANIKIPHTTKYSNIIKIKEKEIYIFFEKPEKNDYENINIIFLTEDLDKIKEMKVKIVFNKVITTQEPEKMRYETSLKAREKNEYIGKFRLLYNGFWSFKLIIKENKKRYVFKDYFYYYNVSL